jgi:hypothetical protein
MRLPHIDLCVVQTVVALPGTQQEGTASLFEIVFLGTSASAPSIRRGLSAQVIKHDEHRFQDWGSSV